MLPASRALRVLPSLARSVVTSTAPKKYVAKPAAARAPAATAVRRPIARKVAATPVKEPELDDVDMGALLPEIPPAPEHATPELSSNASASASAEPSLEASPPPAAPTPASGIPAGALGALPAFPALSAFPSAPIPTPTAAPAHQPAPFAVPVEQRQLDWMTSFHGMSAQPFSEKAAAILMRPLLATEIGRAHV